VELKGVGVADDVVVMTIAAVAAGEASPAVVPAEGARDELVDLCDPPPPHPAATSTPTIPAVSIARRPTMVRAMPPWP
jgi:hypothetical protein